MEVSIFPKKPGPYRIPNNVEANARKIVNMMNKTSRKSLLLSCVIKKAIGNTHINPMQRPIIKPNKQPKKLPINLTMQGSSLFSSTETVSTGDEKFSSWTDVVESAWGDASTVVDGRASWSSWSIDGTAGIGAEMDSSASGKGLPHWIQYSASAGLLLAQARQVLVVIESPLKHTGSFSPLIIAQRANFIKH